MNDKELKELIETEAKVHTQNSIGSISHSLNAKAIAFQDTELKEKLFQILKEEKKRLISIKPISGYGSTMEFYLQFNFENTIKLPIQTGNNALLVVIELITQSVKKVMYPYDMEDLLELPMCAPFSLAVPSSEPILEYTDNFELSEKDKAYFQNIGFTNEELNSNPCLDKSTASDRWTRWTSGSTNTSYWTNRSNGHGGTDYRSDANYDSGLERRADD